jgi:hypothetical protein
VSASDYQAFLVLEARVERLEALLGIEEGIGGPGVFPAQTPPIDPMMARVVGALAGGASIRTAAQALGLDRNRVFRLRQRAIAEGLLPRVSRPETAASAGPNPSTG